MADPNINNITVSKWQIIQTIQNDDKGIPLIPGKPTLIRCFLDYEGQPDLGKNFQVSGSICLKPVEENAPIESKGTTEISAGKIPAMTTRLEYLDHSLNFIMPDDWLEKRDKNYVITCQLTSLKIVGLAHRREVDEKVPYSSVVIEIIGSSSEFTFRVHNIGFRYQSPIDGLYYLPDRIEFDYAKSYLKRTFPISKLAWNETIIDADPVFEPPFKFSDNKDVQREWKKRINAVHMQLMAIRTRNIEANSGEANSKDKNFLTHYYGMVFDPEDSFDGEASDVPIGDPQPEVVSVGQAETYSGYYAAHEIAHTLGRLHPGFPVDDQRREDYPEGGAYPNGEHHFYDKGLISNKILPGGFSKIVPPCYGLDFGDDLNPMRILPWKEWYDVMTYEDNLWVSDYTYNGMMDRIKTENELEDSSLLAIWRNIQISESISGQIYQIDEAYSENFIHIIGEYDVTKEKGSIRYSVPTTKPITSKGIDGADSKAHILTKYGGDGEVQLKFNIGSVTRKSDELLNLYTSFQISIPKIVSIPGNDTQKNLSSLVLRLNDKPGVDLDAIILEKDPKFEDLFDEHRVLKPESRPKLLGKESQRLVRSYIDDEINDYLLTINVKKQNFPSGVTFTIQVKPIDIVGRFEDFKQGYEAAKLMVEREPKHSSEEFKREYKKVKDYIDSYIDRNDRYINSIRQNNIWHTIAVDVENPKNIYLDKELLLISKTFMGLSFDSEPSLKKLFGSIDSDPKSKPVTLLTRERDLIAFELRVFCNSGMEDKYLIGNSNEGVYLIENPEGNTKSKDESNIVDAALIRDNIFDEFQKLIEKNSCPSSTVIFVFNFF